MLKVKQRGHQISFKSSPGRFSGIENLDYFDLFFIHNIEYSKLFDNKYPSLYSDVVLPLYQVQDTL